MTKREPLAKKLLPFLLGMALPLIADDTSTINPSTTDLPPVIELSLPSPKGVDAVRELIRHTEQNLEQQRKLENLLSSYKRAEERYLANPDSQEMVVRLIQVASEILRIVEDQNLNYLIDDDMLSELSLFGRIANKNSLSVQ